MIRISQRWRFAALVVIALAGSCSRPMHRVEPAAHGDFPPFPAGPPDAMPPPIPEVAAMLVRGLPEADRAAATRLLVDDILSRDLRDLPADPAARPGALAIVRAAYHTLVRTLEQLPPQGRLARLATIACARRGDRITRRATALAVARYVVERGRPSTTLVVGYLDEARPYLAMTTEQLQAEADRIEHDLTAHERDDHGCEEQHPDREARHALEAARSGRFDPASGAFYVFLRNAGARPQRLDRR
jgi:hypothetical protein